MLSKAGLFAAFRDVCATKENCKNASLANGAKVRNGLLDGGLRLARLRDEAPRKIRSRRIAAKK
ncbi:hypothetical protein BRPE64_BCDS04770 [Caballeronia insecticola]|uniref:Uncharacterized protein n=1 Tax=Caballeronia insecticola TaxID=758793 RepID=R4WKQ6_9BURK|nr:hypothetical protein BRPE64_BCDS04770 [Caballeronia insecticola]